MNDAPTILLIDHDPGFTYLLQRYARTSGCRFMSASTAEAALDMVRDEPPDLIMIHMLLPPLDGQHVAQLLKVNPLTEHIPVILCTAVAEHGPGWDESADYCLPKPVMYGDFLAVLAKAGVPVGDNR